MEKLSKNIIKNEDSTKAVRLNKYLSDAGFCSRREADRLIEAGKVTIDDYVATMGQKVLPDQIVKVNGKEIKVNDDLILIAYNKPLGVECTTDKRNPDNIVDSINYPSRIYPIGRLDKNSQGLILLTNTGELVNNILKSSNFHEKEYIVKVDKPITAGFIKEMAEGVIIDLEDGKRKVKTRACKVKQIDKNSFSIILTQGLNRQIRRMCKALNYNVIYLERIRIMNIELGNIPIGHYRNVSKSEIMKLIEENEQN